MDRMAHQHDGQRKNHQAQYPCLRGGSVLHYWTLLLIRKNDSPILAPKFLHSPVTYFFDEGNLSFSGFTFRNTAGFGFQGSQIGQLVANSVGYWRFKWVFCNGFFVGRLVVRQGIVSL